jgi:hypothetical protein
MHHKNCSAHVLQWLFACIKMRALPKKFIQLLGLPQCLKNRGQPRQIYKSEP